MSDDLAEKAASATRWSFITEIGVKLISPLVNIALAHILLPSDFGVVASITMITSFAEMLQDAGFQKYLVQHSFGSDDELREYAIVAFWTNIVVAILICGIIVMNCAAIASVLGLPGKEAALVVASLSLPIASLCSIQTALFQRKLDYRSLFIMRISSAFIPLVITLPLALTGFGFWSLVIGTLAGKLFNAIILTIRSDWRPAFRFNLDYLKRMWSFSFWTLLESFSIWLTSWIGVFIIGSNMDEHYVGLYNNSTAVVNSVVAIVSSSVVSVLISTLSKVQSDREAFLAYFLKYQRAVAFVVFLVGFLFLAFGETVTELLLGSNWNEAAILISFWGASSALVVPFANFGSIAYVALGRPRVSFVVQMAYIAVLAPVIFFSSLIGFESLSIASAGCRLVFVGIHIFAMRAVIGIPICPMVKNVAHYLTANVVLACCVLAARLFIGWSIAADIAMGIAYVTLYFLLFRNDTVMIGVLAKLKKRGERNAG